MKIVINSCHGGFSLSRKAFLRLRELGQSTALEEPDLGERWNDGSGPRTVEGFCRDIPRNDPLLIKVIEELGRDASGIAADLDIIEIPDGVEWEIEEYDGDEWVSEKHRTWS